MVMSLIAAPASPLTSVMFPAAAAFCILSKVAASCSSLALKTCSLKALPVNFTISWSERSFAATCNLATSTMPATPSVIAVWTRARNFTFASFAISAQPLLVATFRASKISTPLRAFFSCALILACRSFSLPAADPKAPSASSTISASPDFFAAFFNCSRALRASSESEVLNFSTTSRKHLFACSANSRPPLASKVFAISSRVAASLTLFTASMHFKIVGGVRLLSSSKLRSDAPLYIFIKLMTPAVLPRRSS
mmetsp:Transcript_10934/g.17336  ORF Transcript_10934/g.17336 Transcript_10934/m.17336 type:complete len:253 (-) Transcript_10934:1111-1869(-)